MSIEKKLRSAWIKRLLFINAKGIGYLLVCIVGLVLIDLLIDWQLRLPGYGRMSLLLINVGVLGWIFYSQWLRYLKKYNPLRIALQVEKKYPELKSVLVSYVQLDESSAPSISTQLIKAVRRQASNMGERLDFGVIVNLKKLIRPFVLAVCAAILFAVISMSFSQFISILFSRMTNPFADLTYPTRTKIRFITGNVTIRQGQPVEIAAQCGGEIPKEGKLFVKFNVGQDGNQEKLKLVQDAEKKFTYKFDQVFRDFSYRVRLGDTVSKTYWVKVVSSPVLVQQKVLLKYPDYTGMEPKEVESLNLEVPEGTEIQWLLQIDVPLSEAYMLRRITNNVILEQSEGSEFNQQFVIPMLLKSDGQSAASTLKAMSSFTYSFRWKERSHGYVFDEEIRYSVDVILDTAPEVKIVHPKGGEERATIQKTLDIAFQAIDDYGLAKAWIVYSINDNPDLFSSLDRFDLSEDATNAFDDENTERSPREVQRDPIGSLNGKSVEKVVKWKLRDFIPELKAGDQVICAIEVADNCDVREPNISRSEPFQISIVSREEYLEYILEKRKLMMDEIKSLYKEEDEAYDKVKTLEGLSPKVIRDAN